MPEPDGPGLAPWGGALVQSQLCTDRLGGCSLPRIPPQRGGALGQDRCLWCVGAHPLSVALLTEFWEPQKLRQRFQMSPGAGPPQQGTRLGRPPDWEGRQGACDLQGLVSVPQLT